MRARPASHGHSAVEAGGLFEYTYIHTYHNEYIHTYIHTYMLLGLSCRLQRPARRKVPPVSTHGCLLRFKIYSLIYMHTYMDTYTRMYYIHTYIVGTKTDIVRMLLRSPVVIDSIDEKDTIGRTGSFHLHTTYTYVHTYIHTYILALKYLLFQMQPL